MRLTPSLMLAVICTLSAPMVAHAAPDVTAEERTSTCPEAVETYLDSIGLTESNAATFAPFVIIDQNGNPLDCLPHPLGGQFYRAAASLLHLTAKAMDASGHDLPKYLCVIGRLTFSGKQVNSLIVSNDRVKMASRRCLMQGRSSLESALR